MILLTLMFGLLQLAFADQQVGRYVHASGLELQVNHHECAEEPDGKTLRCDIEAKLLKSEASVVLGTLAGTYYVIPLCYDTPFGQTCHFDTQMGANYWGDCAKDGMCSVLSASGEILAKFPAPVHEQGVDQIVLPVKQLPSP